MPLIHGFLGAQASDAASIAALVIAAIAGVGVGGIIVALVNTRQERERQLRESMLTAADQFLDAAASALSHLRGLHPSSRKVNLGLIGFFAGRTEIDSSADDPDDTPKLQAADIKKADGLLDEAKDRLARVSLLFSPDSVVTEDGEAFLNASGMANAQLKTYYALGQPEIVQKIQKRQESFRKIEEHVPDLVIPTPIPIPLGAIAGVLGGALNSLSDIGRARDSAQELANQSVDEADSAIGSFTLHAWEALRKPSWKPKQSRRISWLRQPSRPTTDPDANAQAIHKSVVDAPPPAES